jgi:hypothetical protein
MNRGGAEPRICSPAFPRGTGPGKCGAVLRPYSSLKQRPILTPSPSGLLYMFDNKMCRMPRKYRAVVVVLTHFTHFTCILSVLEAADAAKPVLGRGFGNTPGGEKGG